MLWFRGAAIAAAVAVAGFAPAASAAPVAVYNWTGFYIGANAGMPGAMSI